MWILEKTKLRLQKRGKTMSRVIHFEIPASDPERASAFYQKVFGWKIEKWPGPMEYWMVTTGAEGTPGINGGLMRQGDVAAPTKKVGVGSVEKAVAPVTRAGGEEIKPQTPGSRGGDFAYCLGNEGELFWVM